MDDVTPTTNPNQLLFDFLKEHNFKLTITALTDNNPFLADRGFVLTDKPLLVVGCEEIKEISDAL